MRAWRPFTDLERLLDALEAELLAATDDEVKRVLRAAPPAPAVRDAIVAAAWTPPLPPERGADRPRPGRCN